MALAYKQQRKERFTSFFPINLEVGGVGVAI